MKTTAVYAAYFAQFLKSRLAYKADFFAGIAANILVAVSGLLFIVFLMNGDSTQQLNGWSREEVLFIYGYSMLAMGIFGTVSPNLYRFGDRYVIQGFFDRVLLRPLGTLPQVLFESFNLESIGSFVTGVLVLQFASARMEKHFSLVDYAWLCASGLSGAVILLSVFVVLASLSFHFEDRLGIAAPVYNLINFSRYPLPIFNSIIQFILSWVVPFGFVAFYPATFFFNRPGFQLFCYLTPVMAVLSMTVAALSWRFGVARYASTGS